MSTLAIECPILPDDVLETMAAAGARFELGINEKRREVWRGPLWIPFLPTYEGQVVKATEPTTFDVTDMVVPDEGVVYAAGAELCRLTMDRPLIHLFPGDWISYHTTLVGKRIPDRPASWWQRLLGRTRS